MLNSSACSPVPRGPGEAPSNLRASTWSVAFGPHLTVECLWLFPGLPTPRSLCVGGMDRKPPTYNDESWQQDSGCKGMGATMSNLISCTSGEEKVELPHLPLSPSQPAQASKRPRAPFPSPWRWGSLAACHCCIMAGCCGRSLGSGGESGARLQGDGSVHQPRDLLS